MILPSCLFRPHANTSGWRSDKPRSFFHALIFIPLILAACGRGGYLVTKDQIAQIEIGASTKQDGQKILGKSKTISPSDVSGTQLESWVYHWAKYASDPHTGVPPIGVTSWPVSRNRRRTTEIEIRFDQTDVVTSIYERTVPQT